MSSSVTDTCISESFAGEIEYLTANDTDAEFDADNPVAGGVYGKPHRFSAGLRGERSPFANKIAGKKVAGGVGDGAPGKAGGLLQIGSSEEGGTCVTLTLPRSASNDERNPGSEARQGEGLDR